MPVISNATVVSGTGFSTQGNGGKKLTRLANGALIAATRSGTTAWQLRKSTDNGANWSQIATVTETVNDLALTSKGNDIHVLVSFSTTGVKHYRYNDSGVLQGTSVNVDSGQSAMGNVSLAINEAGTELHAAWSSKNATYPNSFNIRYAKGTINGDGSVTWGAVEQRTTQGTTGWEYKNPSVTIKGDDLPIIIADYFVNGVYLIRRLRNSGGTWSEGDVLTNSSYAQSSPSALFVPTAINGLANGRLWVAWHGKDATDSAKFNIRASFSDDSGVTWSTPVKLTSGNVFDRQNVTLAADKTGKVFAIFEHHQYAPDIDIHMMTHTGSWSAPAAVTQAEPNSEVNPSALVDFSLQMTTPPFVYTDTTQGVEFMGNFNVGASVSPTSGALGNKETTALTAYTVTPEAGSTVTQIVERINGTIVNTFNNPASLSRTLTVPNATYDTLAYFSTHTASITVTDSNGAQTVTTYSFVKTLATGASLLEATKANTDAKNRISTKRDALAAQVGLSAGATFDAISAQLASGAFMKVARGALPTTNSSVVTSVTNLAFRPKLVIVLASAQYIMFITEDSQLLNDGSIQNLSLSMFKNNTTYSTTNGGDRSVNLTSTVGQYKGRILPNGFEYLSLANGIPNVQYIALG